MYLIYLIFYLPVYIYYIVHPATWFKVDFPDHRVVTFRPSALRPVGEDGKPLQAVMHLSHTPQKSSHKTTTTSGSAHSSAEKHGR